MTKVVLKFRIILIMFAMILTLRVFYLTVTEGDELKDKANKQNTINLDVSIKRNDFLDRYNRHITGLEKRGYIAIFSANDDALDLRNCNLLSEYCDETASQIFERLKNQKKTFVKTNCEVDEKTFANIRNIKYFYAPVRYLNDYPAAAVIGYVADGKGVSGLEKVYDTFLCDTQSSNEVITDARRNLISEINTASNTAIDKKLKTTIDLNFQRICQEALEKNSTVGAVVLLNISDFDVLAMASYPSFEQDDIAKYLNDKNGALQNRCLMAYDMGSIFKIVVSAAAIEYDGFDINKKYYCSGTKTVSGKVFECHNENGHGLQSFCDAFKNSCNCAFIEIGEEIGFKAIADMAKKFGIGDENLNPTDFYQQKGTIPDINNYYLADLANLSIGQGQLSGTVLNGAILSAVIASGGLIKSVNLTDSIIDSYGQVAENLRKDSTKRIVDENTAQFIYKMMLETNISGTGTTAFVDFYGSGGKTGSAQTGWYVNGENYQHGWYTGFFPANNPLYALCVYAENGKSGSVSAAPVFKEIGTRIMNLKQGE